jgi:hypothetical protein
MCHRNGPSRVFPGGYPPFPVRARRLGLPEEGISRKSVHAAGLLARWRAALARAGH